MEGFNMNKREFIKLISNYYNSNKIYIRIWNGFDDDNNDASWLEVFIEDEEYTSIYISDYFEENDENKKLLLKEQKKWTKKVKDWLSNYHKDMELVIDEQNI